MDTTEQLNGTYYYKGMHNLTAGELFFWVFLEEAQKQIGVDDLLVLALFILGQPTESTRAKPAGSTKGTSVLSANLRHWLNVKTQMRLPTLTNGSIKRLQFSYVKNLGAFVGRWIPILGGAFLLNDVATISWKATTTYNHIARKEDKLWN